MDDQLRQKIESNYKDILDLLSKFVGPKHQARLNEAASYIIDAACEYDFSREEKFSFNRYIATIAYFRFLDQVRREKRIHKKQKEFSETIKRSYKPVDKTDDMIALIDAKDALESILKAKRPDPEKTGLLIDESFNFLLDKFVIPTLMGNTHIDLCAEIKEADVKTNSVYNCLAGNKMRNLMLNSKIGLTK